MNSDILIIINPHSGLLNPLRTGIAEIEYHAKNILPGAAIVQTESEEHASMIVSAAIKDGVKTIAAAGGDGTARFMAGILKNTGIPLGLIPCGSAGNVATCLGIPASVRRALTTIKRGRATQLDIGCAGETLFLEAAGLGFHAGVLKKYSRRRSKSLVRSIYSVGVSMMEQKPFSANIEADGEIFKCTAIQITASNLPMYGTGFRIAPDASFSDGLLDLTIVKEMPAWRMPMLAISARAGLLKTDPAVIHIPHVSSITISTDPPVSIHADAENAGESPVTFSVFQKALTVIVP